VDSRKAVSAASFSPAMQRVICSSKAHLSRTPSNGAAYSPRCLLGSIVVAGRGLRPTSDRSVVGRTF